VGEVDCVWADVSVCDVGVFWLKTDRVGFWCESYHRQQQLLLQEIGVLTYKERPPAGG